MNFSKSMWKSKKAQGGNYLSVVIFLMIFGFFNILGYTIWIQVVTSLTSTGLMTPEATLAVAGWTNGFKAFDYLTVLLMAVFIIGTGLLSFKIKTRTAFFIVTFIIGIFWGFVSYFFNYVFIQMVSQPVFTTAIGFFPITMLVCTNLHWIMLVLIIVGSITLYGKKEEEVQTLT